VEPFKQNVELMSVIVNNLAGRNRGQYSQPEEHRTDPNVEYEREELMETTKINQWLLKEGQQKDKVIHNQAYRLKGEIDTLAGENLSLRKQIS
jgi:hypothetical protein